MAEKILNINFPNILSEQKELFNNEFIKKMSPMKQLEYIQLVFEASKYLDGALIAPYEERIPLPKIPRRVLKAFINYHKTDPDDHKLRQKYRDYGCVRWGLLQTKFRQLSAEEQRKQSREKAKLFARNKKGLNTTKKEESNLDFITQLLQTSKNNDNVNISSSPKQ